MIDEKSIVALRMERQHLICKANKADYISLYRDMQPGQNVYWNGFGDPPSLSYRADFDDIAFNRERQRTHALIKGRFAGGNLGWIMPEDLELFAAAYRKPLSKPASRQLELLELIEREGPLTIQQMKTETGMLVKEITPALHRLQEAFLVYEDQYDGKWDRGWLAFPDMFPDIDLAKHTRAEAVTALLQRFARRQVCFDIKMAKSFFKLPEKDIKTALAALVDQGVFIDSGGCYLSREDAEILKGYTAGPPSSVFAMHRNDFLVKSSEHALKAQYTHTHPDTLYYLLIDGVFHGAAVGKFRYTPEVEDILLDLPQEDAARRKDEILRAVHLLCGESNPIRRYQGEPLCE